MKIDFENLRQSLLEYLGTAWVSGNPAAMLELSEVETASPGELIAIAERIGLIERNGENS